MVRTIVVPENDQIKLDIPKEYVGKKIEVTFLSLEELEHSVTHQVTMGDFWGILSDKTASDLQSNVQRSRSEWERDI
ncbi:hypothetical protein [Pedobacter faecalis]|uniref:hypothetical protein n=1 Tax=Pedobacter faecalis TaxID=3041495 RepID=UPI00254C4E7B|nr:hypothetical protein [Pedobacter sp. ELA7]